MKKKVLVSEMRTSTLYTPQNTGDYLCCRSVGVLNNHVDLEDIEPTQVNRKYVTGEILRKVCTEPNICFRGQRRSMLWRRTGNLLNK